MYKEEYPDYTKQQFTDHRPKEIVNLVLVHKEKNESDKLQRECLLDQLRGNIDLIRRKKTPLTKNQIGILADGRTARRILIEGAPGIGKTTFLWQVCHQWALGRLLQQWDLVIMVQLRDEDARTAQSLSDLLYHPRCDIKEAICREIQEKEGENVLFIFDGYDELSDCQRTESFFLKMLRRPSRVLRKATVLVSSRPFATISLPHLFKDKLEQHVEILGFSEEQIEGYLTSTCQDNPDMLMDLKSYISNQPFISSVLYNPLHCSIVTELYHQYWQRGEKSFAPSTLTDLYKALLLNLLQRQLDIDIDDINELPQDIRHQLNQLAKLAAEGIEEKKYIFETVPGDSLGLMHSVKHLRDYRSKKSISYCFTHLTLQEFLAAFHWTELSLQELTELLQRPNLFPIQAYLRGIHFELDMHLTAIQLSQMEMSNEWKESVYKMKETIQQTHWFVLLLLAGLKTIPTELIAPWSKPQDEGIIIVSGSESGIHTVNSYKTIASKRSQLYRNGILVDCDENGIFELLSFRKSFLHP